MPWHLYPTTEYSRFASDWDALADAAGNVPFLSSRFIAPLLAHFATGKERLACFSDGHAVKAMTLVVPRSRAVWETFQPSQLPLGPWVMQPDASLPALAQALLRALPGFPLRLGLTQLDPRVYPRPADGKAFGTLDYVSTAAVAVDGSFDEYWAARGKNLRTNMRKQRKKLAAEGIAVDLEVLTNVEDMAEAIASYGHLESAGWKAAEGTAIAIDNAQGRFYRAMLEQFCAAHRGRVYRYRFAERIVAVDLCIDGGDVEVVLKTTYDESMKAVSPAFLMREEELRTHFAQGRLRRIEFFGKVMDWHTHWTHDTRMLYHANVSRYAWLPAVHALLMRRRAQ